MVFMNEKLIHFIFNKVLRINLLCQNNVLWIYFIAVKNHWMIKTLSNRIYYINL